MRSLFLNIKDKGNPGLRNEIVLGQVTPDKVVRMSKEEMASESVRLLNEKLAEKNLFKAKAVGVTQVSTQAEPEAPSVVDCWAQSRERAETMLLCHRTCGQTLKGHWLNHRALSDKIKGQADAMQAETDAFKCSRCQQRKCTYYQMQTRSADEPMTVSDAMLFGKFGRLTCRPL